MSDLPDMFAFGGYRLSGEEVRALLRPPAAAVATGAPPGIAAGTAVAVEVVKPRRTAGLVKRSMALLQPAMSGQYGAKVALLQAVVQRVRERLEEEKVWSCEKVEYVSQLQHYPHLTHCDFVLTEVDKGGFVEVVSERFVQEFLKAKAAGRGMWFVVPQVPRSVEFGRVFEFGGVVMRGVCDYHVGTDQRMVRLDCMWAVDDRESLICQTDLMHRDMRMESGDGQGRLDLTIRRHS